MIQTTSPAATDISMPRSTCSGPKYLCSPSTSIIGLVMPGPSSQSCGPTPIAAARTSLQPADQPCRREAHQEIHRPHDGIQREVLEIACGDDLRGEHHFLDAHDRAQRGILEQRDEVIAERRDEDTDRLRQE